MSAFVVEREVKGVSVAARARSQWQMSADSKWAATAVWIQGGWPIRRPSAM